MLIFVHELGHFLVAKKLGVCVQRFSLGFGPRIVGVKRGDTDYCLSLIPLGGYVKMLGEDPDQEVSDEELERSFSSQSVWKRIAIVFAGPLANMVLALVIFTGIYAFYGIPVLTTEIGAVTEGSPAAKADLRAGDKVLSINGQQLGSWDEMSQAIEEFGDKPLTLDVERGTERLSLVVTPVVNEVKNIFGEPVRRPLIGVTAAGKVFIKEVNPLAAGYHSLVQSWNLSKLFLLTVVKLIQRVVPLHTLGGPILIAQMAGQQAQEGILNLINFMAFISINLAVLNLLPIPILDGGHLLFFFLEAILGKPVSVRKVEMAQKVGLALLLLLMVVVFYNDIMRLIPGHKPDFMP